MAKEMNKESLQANLKMLDKKGELTLETARQQDPALAAKLEKIKELFENEDFVKTFASCTSIADAAALFAENGLELTEAEVEGLVNQIRIIIEKLVENGGELSEEDLEQIAGGINWSVLGIFGGNVAGGAAIGAIVGSFIPGLGTALGAIIGGVVGSGLGSIGSIIYNAVHE